MVIADVIATTIVTACIVTSREAWLWSSAANVLVCMVAPMHQTATEVLRLPKNNKEKAFD